MADESSGGAARPAKGKEQAAEQAVALSVDKFPVVTSPPINPPEVTPQIITPSPGPAMPGEATLLQFSAQFSASPYPLPEMLARYEQAIPGSATRLMDMVERESNHRRALESKQLEAAIEDQRAERTERRRGQLLGFWMGTIAIVAGSITAVLGHPGAGGVIGTAGVVSLVSVFVLRRVFPIKDAPQTAKPT